MGQNILKVPQEKFRTTDCHQCFGCIDTLIRQEISIPLVIDVLSTLATVPQEILEPHSYCYLHEITLLYVATLSAAIITPAEKSQAWQ